MNAAGVLDAARAVGLCLVIDGDDLVLESSDPPPSAVLDLIRAHKSEIIAAITASKVPSAVSTDYIADWRDWYEERAAILQFDGGHNRAEAERLAWSETHGNARKLATGAECGGYKIAGVDPAIGLVKEVIEQHLPPDQFAVLKAAEDSERTLIAGLVGDLASKGAV